MSQVTKNYETNLGEDFGNEELIITCVYNSISDTISLNLYEQSITLPIIEWENIIDLMNECLKTKGHKLIFK